MQKKATSDEYSDAEAARRRDAITKALIATPPQKHAPMKKKKRPLRKAKLR